MAIYIILIFLFIMTITIISIVNFLLLIFIICLIKGIIKYREKPDLNNITNNNNNRGIGFGSEKS